MLRPFFFIIFFFTKSTVEHPCFYTMFSSNCSFFLMSFVEEICNGPSPAVDCQLSSWSEWSHCTTDCGVGGLQTRTRQRTIYERCGGSCSGGSDLKMERSCPRKTCFNGGSLMGGACSCKEGYTGYCCEKSNYRQKRHNYVEIKRSMFPIKA